MRKIIKYMLLVAIFLFVGCSTNNNEPGDDAETSNKYSSFNDDYLEKDFLDALSDIKADETKVTYFKKIDDWAGGKRYSFRYDSKIDLVIYCNMTSTVDSINYNDEKIYYRGYEAYDINNYVYNTSYVNDLMFRAEDTVKLYLNYPSTAKFPVLSSNWGVARYNNIYYLQSYVDASNAFGTESRFNFLIGYNVVTQEGNMNSELIYFKIDGSVKINNVEDYESKDERKTVTPKNPNKSDGTIIDGINLIYGQLGKYGENTTVDGYTSINYYVPYGKYIMQNNGNIGTIYVASDEMRKNSDGYMENIDTRVYRFKVGTNGETQEIDIPEGYHIELSISTNIILKEIEQN